VQAAVFLSPVRWQFRQGTSYYLIVVSVHLAVRKENPSLLRSLPTHGLASLLIGRYSFMNCSQLLADPLLRSGADFFIAKSKMRPFLDSPPHDTDTIEMVGFKSCLSPGCPSLRFRAGGSEQRKTGGGESALRVNHFPGRNNN
jgi:hypothetical protein